MTNSIILVTSPDDTDLDGKRILLVDLTPEQTQLVSNAISEVEGPDRIVVYLWRTGDNIDWLLDKKHKSKHIIFNADSTNDLIVGYLTAQPNSSYLGTLKCLGGANNSAIYSLEQCKFILENLI